MTRAAITQVALSTFSKIGDGKIFVSPLEQVIGKPHLRIRTGETGKDAV